jgi:hypothetical protein
VQVEELGLKKKNSNNTTTTTTSGLKPTTFQLTA